jgi:hypothetical protein
VSAELPAGLTTFTVENATSHPDSLPFFARLVEDKTFAEYQAANAAGAATGDTTAADAMLIFLGGSFGTNTLKLQEGLHLVELVGPPGTPDLITTFAVTGTAVTSTPPVADLQIDLVDFSFALPNEIQAGKQLWQINNVGTRAKRVLPMPGGPTSVNMRP